MRSSCRFQTRIQAELLLARSATVESATPRLQRRGHRRTPHLTSLDQQKRHREGWTTDRPSSAVPYQYQHQHPPSTGSGQRGPKCHHCRTSRSRTRGFRQTETWETCPPRLRARPEPEGAAASEHTHRIPDSPSASQRIRRGCVAARSL